MKTGIAEAIAQQLSALQGNKNAVAETIENNVRSKIIKEHLHDPAYYEKMSALLDEIIAARKAKAIEYVERSGMRPIIAPQIQSVEWSKYVSFVGWMAVAALTRLETYKFLKDPDLAALVARLI